MASFIDWCKAASLAALPHHAVSRVVYWLTRRSGSAVTPIIDRFVALYNVDMDDAVEPDTRSYATFNAFFTRAIKPKARPIANGESEIACPADGRISAIGPINQGQIFQAKGIDYSLADLLADETLAKRFENGSFATVYLSPRDYHRLHMPLTGTLLQQTHVPGRLYSVAPHTVNTINGIFTRNERVVATFNTDCGLMSLVLVGAINVAAIETVWHGLITPPAGQPLKHWHYESEGSQTITLEKGAEMGRFNMGSTIIAVFENPVRWRFDMSAADPVRMGQFMGHHTSA
jgi:phosphatidylserine decarboxylase